VGRNMLLVEKYYPSWRYCQLSNHRCFPAVLTVSITHQNFV